MRSAVSVVLFKRERPSDPYRLQLEEAGFEVCFVPTLQFAFPNGDVLRSRLKSDAAYGGLILTSPRAAKALQNHRDRLEPWVTKGCFVVGPRTAEEARSLGLTPVGHDSGSARELGKLIRREAPEERLLFLVGNRRRDVLPDVLEESQIAFEEITVYTSQRRERLDWPAGIEPDWVVFFSPSGVATVVGQEDERWVESAKAAIGSTTADALEEAGWTIDAVAAEPSPQSLRRALLDDAERFSSR